MTYNVFSGTLNPAQSINQSINGDSWGISIEDAFTWLASSASPDLP